MTAIRSRRPAFSESDAAQIARTLFGLTGPAMELPSERDQNFHFCRDDGQEFTLKISNSDESSSVLDFQNRAMEKVAHDLAAGSSSRLQRAMSGTEIVSYAASDGNRHLVRLVSFVPGTPFATYRPHSPELLSRLGRLLGEVDRSLATLTHASAKRELYWDMKNAAQVIGSYKHLIGDPQRRKLVENALDGWNEQVVPALPDLRTSIIHNDANDYNVIVGRERLTLIDFGDMVHTWTLCEVAIACAYVMLDKPDPVDAARHVVAGYHAAYPLSEKELELLFYFIRMRLCMSVTIAAHQQQLEPDNTYLQISEKPAWTLLEKLNEIHPRLAHYRFRDACGLPACPQSAAAVSWLKENAESFARVVDADMSGAQAIVFDLSIGSLELGTRDEFTDVERVTRRLFNRLRDANATVGVGRYNEPRGLYTSSLFQPPGNEGPDWRTIHLGIDLFMEAGSRVHTPADGVVYSVRNNDALLDYGPTIVIQHPLPGGGSFYTLYGHLSMDSLDGPQPGTAVPRGQEIARIGNYPQNGNWPPHLHFQLAVDFLDREGEFPGVASANQRSVWLSLSPDPNLMLGIPASKFPVEPPSAQQTHTERKERLGRNLSLSYKKPLKIVRGAGCYLYDEEGRGYLDCVNNVAHVGHTHPRVVHAAQAQMAVLNTNTRYLNDNIVEYARRLSAKMPEHLSVCYFVNSGSEANDLALRLSRAHTKSKEIVVMDGGYHGNLSSLVEISPYKFDGPGGHGAPPHVHQVRAADRYRGSFKYDDPKAGSRYAAEIRVILEKLEGRPASFIIESLLSCAGQVVLPPGYLKEAFELIRSRGGVCIADEVQVGFGRVGSHFWGFETQGVIPDIVTMGKSIGNGHPLGAVITTPEIAASFNNGMEYFNTYGGNPVSCAVGLAVLDVIENERLQDNALQIGNRLKLRLSELQEGHPRIGDVRGAGLFLGIEMVRDRDSRKPAAQSATYVVERMKSFGILLSTDGPFHNVIKFKPPIVFSTDEAQAFETAIARVLYEEPLIAGLE